MTHYGFMSYCFFSSRRRHTSWPRDWSSDVCSSDLVARLDLAAVDDFVALDHTDAESGEIVIVTAVHAGHLGGFAAYQGAARLAAAFGYAVDDGSGGIHIEATGRVVIQKKQRFGTAHQQIVDAHGDQVDT